MLRDFSKIQTFITVVETKSFSKASEKIGISQPAVTQQIKLIEDHLQCQIIERKKNGIVLTKEGEEFYKVAMKLARAIKIANKELQKIINRELPFHIGASYTIGNYILPGILTSMKDNIDTEINVNIDKSANLESALLNRKIDIALIESPSMDDRIYYKEWLDDEIVVFSNQKLPKVVTPKDLEKFEWIYREEGSNMRELTRNALESKGIDCSSFFDVGSIFNNSTAVKHTVLKFPKNSVKPVASIISKYVIEDEVNNGMLFSAKIEDCSIDRKIYIAYLKEKAGDVAIDKMIGCLFKNK